MRNVQTLLFPNRDKYVSLVTPASANQVRFIDDSFLQQNPVLGIYIPPLDFGTSNLPDGQSIDAADLLDCTLTLWTKQELLIDSRPLCTFVPSPTAPAQRSWQPVLFEEPQVIDFTRSYVQYNGGPSFPTPGRIIPFYFFWVPAGQYQEHLKLRELQRKMLVQQARQYGIEL